MLDAFALLQARATLLRAKMAAQHVLVTGPSGAGKSTLAKQLAEERGMPLARIDDSPSWRALFNADTEDRHMVPGTPENVAYQTLRRRLAAAAMRRRTPSIIEGTQLMSLDAQRAAPHELHLVAPTRDTVIERRLGRDLTKPRHMEHMDKPEYRQRRQELAGTLYDMFAPDVARWRTFPGVNVKDGDLSRYVTGAGEGAWRAGKRELPPELAGDVAEARRWLARPELPEGAYESWFTPAGAARYEATLKPLHERYLGPIQRLQGRPAHPIAHEDEHQVIFAPKSAAAHPALADLKKAKAESDRGNYRAKHHILSRLLSDRPGEFVQDSASGGMIGLTHKPTSFKIHAPADVVGGRAKAADEKPYRDRVEMYGVHPSGKLLGGFYHDDRSFGTFGGGIDPGEDPATAGAREYFEESGRRIHDPVMLDVPAVTNEWSPPYSTPAQAARAAQFRGSRTLYAAGRLGDEPPELATDPSGLVQIKLRNLTTAIRRMQTHGALLDKPYHAGRITALRALAKHPLVTGAKTASVLQAEALPDILAALRAARFDLQYHPASENP